MGHRPSYSKEFKEAIAAKILNRGNRTVDEVCESEGIGKSTARNWLKGVTLSGMSKPSKKWTPEAKLKAITDTHAMSGEELGEYLRREGLHSQDLKSWRDEILKGLAPAQKVPKKDERDEKIRVLERDLRRKDKALAEASALLILQKKIDLIWGNKGEDEK